MSLEALGAEIKKMTLKDRAALAKWIVRASTSCQTQRSRHRGSRKLSAVWINWSREVWPRFQPRKRFAERGRPSLKADYISSRRRCRDH